MTSTRKGNKIRPNLIITGFMGTGKTAVGTAVAQRLGREFVDTDRILEARLGLAVPEIFAVRGEAFFRDKEAELVEELAESSGKIIATGGGTLVSDANRERIAPSGVIVNLRCSPEALVKRLEQEHHRPLIEGEDRARAIKRLWEARQPQYDKIPWHVDTTSLGVDEVADQIVSGYLRANGHRDDSRDPERFAVDWPTGSYDVVFGRRIVGQVGAILRQGGLSGPMALVAPPLVGGFYAAELRESLQSAGFPVHYIEIPDGETHKNLDTVNYLYERFVDSGIDRSSTIVTLGGGVASDTGGYAAATYMRGVPLVHVPTTLLAQVDASIGDKVAVDHSRGKNLIGTFYAPRLVLIDPFMLRSLPTTEIRSGSAEIVKAAMIRSAELFALLEQAGSEPTDDIILESIRIKAEIAGGDPFEKGERAILNFGHTVGHAIETVSRYRVRHGEAVSIGMMAATRIAVSMNLCDSTVEDRLGSLLHELSLPLTTDDLTSISEEIEPGARDVGADGSLLPGGGVGQNLLKNALNPEEIWRAMAVDKKKRGGKLQYVLPTAVGEVIVSAEVPEEVVHQALREVVSANR